MRLFDRGRSIAVCVTMGIVALAALSDAVVARTWQVEPGGLAFQEALDLAAPGDVVELAPGRYDQWMLQTGEWTRRTIAFVEGSGITIRGSGQSTIIGPDVPHRASGDDPIGIQLGLGAENLTIENLIIENLREGVAALGSVTLRGITLRDCHTGFLAAKAHDVLFENCVFANNVWAGLNCLYSTAITVRNCRSNGGLMGYFSHSTDDVIVEGCTMIGGGLQFYLGAKGTVRECRITQSVFGIHMSQVTNVDLQNNFLECTRTALVVADGAYVSGSGNVFRALESSTLHFQNGAWGTLSGNHISIDSPEPAVKLQYYWQDWYVNNVVDLRNNYWFTTDPDVVAQEVWDRSDDPSEYAVATYLPIEDQRVRTESTTLGQLKARFGSR